MDKIIQLATKSASELLREIGNAVTPDGDATFYFLPYWFEDLGNGNFKMHRLGDLPHGLQRFINSERDNDMKREEEKITSADPCIRCGGPIDHNDPHLYCSDCS